ncbi:MAG TPA: carbon starvation CstA family protein [Actinomycetota bacterium]|nr:carbon starvation CstA family protein [Actinomycetota bacterium]
MNSLWVVVIGGVVILLAYNFYAKAVDRRIIQSDRERATPARMYMDGVDFVPTSRFVLYGYHFKSIAAAGPIVGVIVASALWGWLPAILWLMVGVSFIGWVSDYSAIMVAVRNDGNSMSAVAHRLISPRSRTILFVFIFFYLLLIGGAFVGIMAGILDARPDVPFGILVLALMGLLAGWLIYRRRAGIIGVTLAVVVVTILAMALGPVGVPNLTDVPPSWDEGVISGPINAIDDSVNAGGPWYQVTDPTNADPRIPPPDPETGERASTPTYNAETGQINVFPSFVVWAIFLLVFSYLGANLPIWRFAQPVNYIGFWITALTIGLSAIGAVLAPLGLVEGASDGSFLIPAFNGFAPPQTTNAIQPLWPMLFVTIACGAISGWHALFGSVGTARQLEFETDALPVGGGGMFSENTLGLLSLTAVAITGAAGAGAFAAGVGNLLNVVTFGALPLDFGTALGFGVFVVIVLTVVQLVFRLMRVTLGEWLGNRWVGFRNQHVASIIGMLLVLGLVLTGTWVYLWQLFGASNQLLAGLSLLIVTVWLVSTRRNAAFAGIPMLFMYVTTIAATIVTAYNLYQGIIAAEGVSGIPVIGAWAMIIVAALLIVAALIIAADGWKAYSRYRREPIGEPAPGSTTAPAAPTSR